MLALSSHERQQQRFFNGTKSYENTPFFWHGPIVLLSASEWPDGHSVHTDGFGQVQDIHLAPEMYAVCLGNINLTLPSIQIPSVPQARCAKKKCIFVPLKKTVPIFSLNSRFNVLNIHLTALCDREVANTNSPICVIMVVYYTDGHGHVWVVNRL